MSLSRVEHTLTLLPSGEVLAAGGSNSLLTLTPRISTEIFDPLTGRWRLSADLLEARVGHTATLLPSGRVLVVGGKGSAVGTLGASGTAELYDPISRQWTATGSLNDPRINHSATLLPTGEVLVVGGVVGQVSSSAELYDPISGEWQRAGSLLSPRSDHSATLLRTGEVLIAGGGSDRRAELYDPWNQVWSETGELLVARQNHSATLLSSGRILVVGGELNIHQDSSSSEIYDPVSGEWTHAGTVPGETRIAHTALHLPSDRVLIVGGRSDQINAGDPTANAAIYDPLTGSWTSAPGYPREVSSQAAILLPSGAVMVTGGQQPLYTLRSTHLYYPNLREWTAVSDLEHPRTGHSATLLPSGKVLVAGGSSTVDIELYDPITKQWETFEGPVDWGSGHSATLLSSGEVLLVAGAEAAIFDPETEQWTAAATPAVSRRDHRATLLASGKVLVTGGQAMPHSAEIYDPATNTWTNAAEMLFPRALHSATLLDSGKLLAIGGGSFHEITIPELYDPATDRWQSAAALNKRRQGFSSVLLSTGDVLVTGGSDFGLPVAISEVERFAPASEEWTFEEPMLEQRFLHTTSALSPWQILVAGSGDSQSAELFEFASRNWRVSGDLLEPRFGHSATLLRSGDLLVVGGSTPGSEILASAEIYELATPSGRQPSINGATDPIRFGEPLVISGNFRADSDSGGGNSQSSSANVPFIVLRSVDGRQHHQLEVDPKLERGASFWQQPSSLTVSELPSSLVPGPYLLTVSVAGISSEPVLVDLQCSLSVGGLSADPAEPLPIGGSLTLSAETQGARRWQWRKDGEDIAGATGPTYTTPPVNAADAGTTYSLAVENDCTHALSDSFTVEIFDEEPPQASVLDPNGGEYWPLSEIGQPPNSELITWEMTDNVRICQVEVSLTYSADGGVTYQPLGETPMATFGRGGPCSLDERVETTSLLYEVPVSPPSGLSNSLYKIQLAVTDQAGNVTTATSTYPFYIVEPNADAVKTLILRHLPRMKLHQGLSDQSLEALDINLRNLADHSRVLGLVVDLDQVGDLDDLYQAWDDDIADPLRANRVLFGCQTPLPAGCSEEKKGVHGVIRDLMAIYAGVESIVVVGDDRIIPMARIEDRTTVFSEINYPGDPAFGEIDLTIDGTTVGQALAANKFLTDDPLAILDSVHPDDLNNSLFIPDVAIGRLVETPQEIITTIATFISNNGLLDLSSLDSETGHKFQVTGYDFLQDSAAKIRRRWQSVLGDSYEPDDLAPVDGELVGQDWNEVDLQSHVCGNAGPSYGLVSLNGHATHYAEGIPGDHPFDIQGLTTFELTQDLACDTRSLDLSGSVIFAVGCHGGLPVPGSEPNDLDHSLDLPQVFLSRGAVAYIANSGYGWGLRLGIGYSERLVDLFSQEMSRGDTISIGEAVLAAKLKYFLEAPRFDPYDEKTSMQWTVFGLPMYAVDPGFDSDTEAPSESKIPEPNISPETEIDGAIRIERTRSGDRGLKSPLPAHLVSLELRFDLSADGVYRKYNALGELLGDVEGCPAPSNDEPEGCYYTLNGLVERSTGITDHPIQPLLIYDSKLAGTSQHGVLWLGGEFEEEADWVPIIAELASNGGDASNHGVAPRLRRILPTAPRWVLGEDPPECRSSDLENNGVVVTAAEFLKNEASDPTYDIQRIYRDINLEMLYFNNQDNSLENCDRLGPELEPGYGDQFHQLGATTIDWAIKAHDEAEVWRVLVVHTDGRLDAAGRGRWSPLELNEEGDLWRGSLSFENSTRLSYLVQAVDRKGNVSWVQYFSPELPDSEVELGLAEVVDVEIELGQADLSVAISDSPDPIETGATLLFTFSVENAGPDAATAIQVDGLLPPSTTWLTAGGEGWACDQAGGALDCRRDFLAAGDIAPPITVAVKAPEVTGTLVSSVSVSALQPDPTPANEASETTAVIAMADLGLSIDDGQTVAIPGESIVYAVSLEHGGGPAVVTAVELEANLPEALLNPIFEPMVGTNYDPETGLWSSLELRSGDRATMLIRGDIDALAEGELRSHLSVVPSGAILDPNLSDNVAEDVDDLADIQAPDILRVHSVSSTDHGQIDDGESTDAALTQLYVIFDEPVHGAAHLSHFLLVEAGDDGTLQSETCSTGVAGDDRSVAFEAIAYESGRTVLWLPDSTPLSIGHYRLMICDGIADLAGNKLQPKGHQFRVGADHLLRNPTFDQSLGDWQLEIPISAEVHFHQDDIDAAPTSGSVHISGSGGSDPVALWQCVSWTGEQPLHFGGQVKIVATSAQGPSLAATAEVFPTGDCSGEPIASKGAQVTPTPIGLWQALPPAWIDEPGSASVLMSFVVQAASDESYEVRFDDLFLRAGQLFGDGFESGDMSRWSAVVP